MAMGKFKLALKDYELVSVFLKVNCNVCVCVCVRVCMSISLLIESLDVR